MNTNMQGHNQSGKSHLLGMLGIGAVVLVVLLGTGRSLQEALPTALFLACPLMMVGMMVMMRGGGGNEQGNDTTTPHDTTEHPNFSNPRDTHPDPAAPASVQDSARTPETLFDNRHPRIPGGV